jgi:hypothetical protein
MIWARIVAYIAGTVPSQQRVRLREASIVMEFKNTVTEISKKSSARKVCFPGETCSKSHGGFSWAFDVA